MATGVKEGVNWVVSIWESRSGIYKTRCEHKRSGRIIWIFSRTEPESHEWAAKEALKEMRKEK